MDFVETVANLDQSPQLHAVRLLLLLDAFAEDDRTGAMVSFRQGCVAAENFAGIRLTGAA